MSVDSTKKSNFNGFCFGVNITAIKPAAFEPYVHLFDPISHGKVSDSLTALTLRMKKFELYPIILQCAFVYHFRNSITDSSSANFTQFEMVVQSFKGTVIKKSTPSYMINVKFPDPKRQG